MPKDLSGLPTETRLALLEARMRLVVLFLEGLIVAFVTALIAFFFGR